MFLQSKHQVKEKINVKMCIRTNFSTFSSYCKLLIALLMFYVQKRQRRDIQDPINFSLHSTFHFCTHTHFFPFLSIICCRCDVFLLCTLQSISGECSPWMKSVSFSFALFILRLLFSFFVFIHLLQFCALYLSLIHYEANGVGGKAQGTTLNFDT